MHVPVNIKFISPDTSKFYLLCLTTCFGLSHILRFTICLQNILREKYTLCKSIKLKVIKMVKYFNGNCRRVCVCVCVCEGSAATVINIA